MTGSADVYDFYRRLFLASIHAHRSGRSDLADALHNLGEALIRCSAGDDRIFADAHPG